MARRPLEDTIVLVVGEDRIWVAALVTALRAQGGHVHVAESVRESVWVLMNSPFLVDVLVCDAAFASRDALDLMRVIRRDRTSPLRTVAASRGGLGAEEARRAGFEDFVESPTAEPVVEAVLRLVRSES